MITPQDRKVFTMGGCHRLALAISKATGWPVCAFWEYSHYDFHAFVRTPAGTYLDINGEHTRDEICSYWAADAIRTVRTGYRFREWDASNPYRSYSDLRADELVPDVLAMCEGSYQ